MAIRRPTYSSSDPTITSGTIGASVRSAISAAPRRNVDSSPDRPGDAALGEQDEDPARVQDRARRGDVLLDADAAPPDRQDPADAAQQPLLPRPVERRRRRCRGTTAAAGSAARGGRGTGPSSRGGWRRRAGSRPPPAAQVLATLRVDRGTGSTTKTTNRTTSAAEPVEQRRRGPAADAPASPGPRGRRRVSGPSASGLTASRAAAAAARRDRRSAAQAGGVDACARLGRVGAAGSSPSAVLGPSSVGLVVADALRRRRPRRRPAARGSRPRSASGRRPGPVPVDAGRRPRATTNDRATRAAPWGCRRTSSCSRRAGTRARSGPAAYQMRKIIARSPGRSRVRRTAGPGTAA